MEHNQQQQPQYAHQGPPSPPSPSSASYRPYRPYRPPTADGHALHDDDYHGGEDTPLTPPVHGRTDQYHSEYGYGGDQAVTQAGPAYNTSPSNPSDDQPTDKRRLPFSKKTQKRLYW